MDRAGALRFPAVGWGLHLSEHPGLDPAFRAPFARCPGTHPARRSTGCASQVCRTPRCGKNQRVSSPSPGEVRDVAVGQGWEPGPCVKLLAELGQLCHARPLARWASRFTSLSATALGLFSAG